MNFRQNQEFDAIVIGGGAIGLGIARELKKNNLERVAVFEKNPVCGAEASNAAAGILAPQAEADNANDFFHLCRQSRALYPRFAAELLDETNVDIELDQNGTLYLAFNDSDLAELEHRFKWQQAANLPIEKLNSREILELESNISPQVLGGLRFSQDWQTENRKLVQALNKWQDKFYVLNAPVQNLLSHNEKIIGVETDKGNFYAPAIIIAAGAWASQLTARQSPNFVRDFEKIKITPIRGQILSFQTNQKLFDHTVYSTAGYVVPRRDNRILVGATVENVGFDCRVTTEGTNSLLKIADEISACFQDLVVSDQWSGLRPKSMDAMPLLGEFPPKSGLFWATGHYRNGILLAPLTAKLIADKICHNADSPFLEIFNPARFIDNSE